MPQRRRGLVPILTELGNAMIRELLLKTVVAGALIASMSNAPALAAAKGSKVILLTVTNECDYCARHGRAFREEASKLGLNVETKINNFDAAEQANLLGADVLVRLHEVFSRDARYCLMFASASYVRKPWTSHERRAAQERALRDHESEYILPVDIDGTGIPVSGPCGVFAKNGIDYACGPLPASGNPYRVVVGDDDGRDAGQYKVRFQRLTSDAACSSTDREGATTASVASTRRPIAARHSGNTPGGRPRVAFRQRSHRSTSIGMPQYRLPPSRSS